MPSPPKGFLTVIKGARTSHCNCCPTNDPLTITLSASSYHTEKCRMLHPVYHLINAALMISVGTIFLYASGFE